MKLNSAVTKISLIILMACVAFAVLSCNKKTDAPQVETDKGEKSRPKILLVNSYHYGYAWSDSIEKGIAEVLNFVIDDSGNIDDSNSKVEFRVFRMDTKRNSTEEFKIMAGLTAKKMIETWQPDLVITSDDNAFKYLVVPHYQDSSLPFVFCGINNDMSLYEKAPYSNTTGMIEVALFDKVFEELQKLSSGTRIGFLGSETLTERRNYEHLTKNKKMRFEKKYFVKTFDEWEVAYKKLQSEVDYFIWINNAGIEGWDRERVLDVIYRESKIPAGTVSGWMTEYALLGYLQIPEEQGEWVAKTSLEILNGKSPEEIPVTTNKKGKIILNMQLAKKLGIEFPIDLIDIASFVHE